MKQFSYTKSPELSSKVALIESLRSDILLKALSPSHEIELQWNAVLDRIYYSFLYKGNTVTKEHIASLLTPAGQKKVSPQDKQILKYKSALDYIYYEWLVSDESITTETITTLYRIGFDGKLRGQENEIKKILDYVQVNPEQPIVQAAIAQCLLLDLSPFSEENERFANLVFCLFTYKYGYDFRRMLDPEEYFYQTLFRYNETKSNFSKSSNITKWIEYVTEGAVLQLNKVINNFNSLKNNVRDNQYVLELNDRQKQILSILEQPGLKVSNKDLQDMFKVSQITASRDLSKMANSGLIIPIGKGRSTYYTKI